MKKANVRNATVALVLPPLVAGGEVVVVFQAQIESLPAKQQTVQGKEAILRTLATKEDRQNKRKMPPAPGVNPPR